MERPLNFEESRPKLEEHLAFIEKNRHPMIFILDHLTDKRNIAALFRLADAARIEHIYFYGKKGPDLDARTKRIARAASGFVPSSTIDNFEALVLLKNKYHFTALEITNLSKPYYQYEGPEAIALVIGNEQRGVSLPLLQLCEQSVHIPMMGRNASMNVAMAAGIVTYGLLENTGKLPKK